MENEKKKNEIAVILREIQIFAEDVYDYILLRTDFGDSETTKEFIHDYTNRNPVDIALEQYDDFIDRVGKAVRISQFLLRDYLFSVLQLIGNTDKNTYKQEVKLMGSHWIKKRNNIFVKIIDALAIIAEALLFNDCYVIRSLEAKEIKEWFIEWFGENFAPDFIKSGGWKSFLETVIEMYTYLESLEENIINKTNHLRHVDDVHDIYDCSLISFLRNSRVQFPIPEYAICDKCRHLDDKKQLQRIVYVKLMNEYIGNCSANTGKSDVHKTNKLEREEKKVCFNKKKLKENLSFSTQIKNGNGVHQNSFSNKVDDNVVAKDWKYLIGDISSDSSLNTSEIGKCATDSEHYFETEDFSTLRESPSIEEGLFTKKNAFVTTADSTNEAGVPQKTDTLIKNFNSEKQADLPYIFPNHTDIEKLSNCIMTVNISSEPTINMQSNSVHKPFPTNEILQVSSCQEIHKLEDTNVVSLATIISAESSVPESDLPVEDSSSKKKMSDSFGFLEQQPKIEASNDSHNRTHLDDYYESVFGESVTNHVAGEIMYSEGSLELFQIKISFRKSVTYDEFFNQLGHNVMNEKYQIMGEQHNFHFISKIYSNSLWEMFKTHFNEDEEKLIDNNDYLNKFIMAQDFKNIINDLYCKMSSTVLNDGKFEQTFYENFNSLEFITGEYRYYYFKERTSATFLKPKKKRKRKRKSKNKN